MAVIKAVNSKSSLKSVIQYITNKEKTEEKLVSGKDCNAASAFEEMQTTKELFDKADGRQYKHFIQSFDPQDNLNHYQAHKIGLEWAEMNFKGYEVLVATHQDKEHIHNHFVVNSVSFENGEKYRQSKKDLEKMKELSDKICQREGLHVIAEKTQGKELSMKEYQVAIKGDSWKFKLMNEIDKSMQHNKTKEEFMKSMEDKGYKVNWSDTRKYITYTTPEGKKVRDNKLHDEKYTKEVMENGFKRAKENELTGGRDLPSGIHRGTKGNRTGFGFNWDKSNSRWIVSGANHFEQQSDEAARAKRKGQEGIRRETSREQQRQEQYGIKDKSTNKGHETGNRRLEEPELSRINSDIKEGVGRTDQEPAKQQGTNKASDEFSISSEKYTESIIPGKSEAIFNSTYNNSGIDRGNNGNISTGDPFDEALKIIGDAIQKADQKEKALAEKEKVKLEKKMNRPSKGKDFER